MIKEWNLLRVIACLSIVLLHSTTNIGRVAGYPDSDYYHFFRALLCYATPTFIIISEVILANRYPEKLPNKFWGNKFKYLYIPFVAFAIIDSFVGYHLNPKTVITDQIVDNIFLGTYSGYFILIIFQFYFLHLLVTKIKIPMKYLTPLSFIIMIGHLTVINSELAFVKTNWLYVFLPFTAWFGYFTIAYVIGRDYDRVRKFLFENKWLLSIGLIFAFSIIYFSYFKMGHTPVNSRRLDLFPFVIIFSLFVMAWGQHIPDLKIVNFLSNYSFGIYLVHWQLQRLIAPYVANISDIPSLQVFGLFAISLTLTIIVIKLISLIPLGSFIIGKTKRESKKKVTAAIQGTTSNF